MALRARIVAVLAAGTAVLAMAAVGVVPADAAPSAPGAANPSASVNYCAPAAAPTVTTDANYEALFTRSGPGWTGADGGVSTLLPDGRGDWVFSDTWLGTATGSAPDRWRDVAASPFVRSSMLTQTGSSLTLDSQALQIPAASMLPAGANDWWWPNDPVVEGNFLRVPVYQMTNGGAMPFPFVFTGLQGIATFSLPSLSFVSITTLATDPNLPIYGQSIFASGGYDYIWSSDSAGLVSYGHVARVPVGQLSNTSAWTYFTGTSWSSDPYASARISNGNPQAIVQRAGGYVMFSVPTFSNVMTSSYACSPAGPWSPATDAYTIPQVSGDEYAYGPAVHPEIDNASGQLLVSYDTNSLSASASNVDLYRPHFVRVGLAPMPQQESDLTVTSVSASVPNNPRTLRPGQVATLHATIKNTGSAATPVGTMVGVGFYVDGARVAWTTTMRNALMPGASLSVTPDAGAAGAATMTLAAGTHSLRATVDDTSQILESNETDNSATTSLAVIPWPVPPIRVNAGGSAAYRDSAGRVWAADTNFVGGSTDFSNTRVSGTGTSLVLQSERYGMSAYHIPIANGTYHLHLIFAETIYSKKGQRVFNVSVQGATVLRNFDIFAKVGHNAADVESFTAKVTGNSLDLGFTAVKDLPKISAIEILP